MAIDKQTRINTQIPGTDYTNDAGPQSVVQEFSNVNEAKAYFYTSDQLALFDTWGESVQWAVINDDDSKPTRLKVTMNFANEGDAVKFQSALETHDDAFTSQRNGIDSGTARKSPATSAESSSDHLF